jgi:hypothetical protein
MIDAANETNNEQTLRRTKIIRANVALIGKY